MSGGQRGPPSIDSRVQAWQSDFGRKQLRFATPAPELSSYAQPPPWASAATTAHYQSRSQTVASSFSVAAASVRTPCTSIAPPQAASAPRSASQALALDAARLNHGLFCLFHHWQQFALGDQPPAGLRVPPVRSADADWPLGAVLPAFTCLLRSRLARIERLRSVRRWYLLYTSHSSMMPATASHLSCLGRGLHALREYHFYVRVANEVMDEAADELLRARLVHGLRMWRRALARLARAQTYGPLSLAARCLQSWAAHVARCAEVEVTSLARAERWVA